MTGKLKSVDRYFSTEVRDATSSLEDLAKDGPFDRILLDAPCSGLGSLRRNPDARWRIQPDDLLTVEGAVTNLIRARDSLGLLIDEGEGAPRLEGDNVRLVEATRSLGMLAMGPGFCSEMVLLRW